MYSEHSPSSFNYTEHGIVFAVIPVFNKLHFTKNCIDQLLRQTYPRIKIILSDGGSTDGTVEYIRDTFPDVEILKSSDVLWWSGAMFAGIDYALKVSSQESDFILMMNNDTNISTNYVETLVNASLIHKSAVGGTIVDSRTGIILDAGEYINWTDYSFPVENQPNDFEQFRGDVDLLPGRGTLVPIQWISKIGNINVKVFPHYLGDYDFFYRLKKSWISIRGLLRGKIGVVR